MPFKGAFQHPLRKPYDRHPRAPRPAFSSARKGKAGKICACNTDAYGNVNLYRQLIFDIEILKLISEASTRHHTRTHNTPTFPLSPLHPPLYFPSASHLLPLTFLRFSLSPLR